MTYFSKWSAAEEDNDLSGIAEIGDDTGCNAEIRLESFKAFTQLTRAIDQIEANAEQRGHDRLHRRITVALRGLPS